MTMIEGAQFCSELPSRQGDMFQSHYLIMISLLIYRLRLVHTASSRAYRTLASPRKFQNLAVTWRCCPNTLPVGRKHLLPLVDSGF